MRAEVNDQRWVVEAIVILTSNSVVATSKEASLSQRIEATHRIMLDILHKQFRHRRWSDVAVEKAPLARREATLPPLERQLAIQRDLLTALARRLALPSERDLDAASGTGTVERFFAFVPVARRPPT